MNDAKYKIQSLLDLAEVSIDGPNPYDIQVHNSQLYQRILAGGSLALGESYMDGWWDAERPDQFFDRILTAKLEEKITGIDLFWDVVKAKISNMQRPKKAFDIGKRHYDTGNDLFTRMLDKRMNYSCGYWKDAKTLDEAQEAKLELICKKINIREGMSILDIGCGWGGFAKYAAEKYDAKVTGITVSEEQIALAKELTKGLPVTIRYQDYRKLDEKFDAIISIGMFEHVGYKNYKEFMKIASKNLKDDGLFLLHTIGSKKSNITGDAWTSKYIFPRGMLPSVKQIGKSIENLFIMEDWHNFGADYDKTLMVWHKNFNDTWHEIKHNYGRTEAEQNRFFRMWNYYLLSFAGSFRSRRNQLWQVVLSKDGVRGGYTSIR